MDPVPVEDLVDLQSLRRDGRDPTPKQIREALPPGWVLDADGRTARRDLRVLARDGWVLVIGLVCFGAAGLAFLYDAMPRGWAGVLRFAGLIAILLLAGGVVAPTITRALMSRQRGK
ncbi:MAG: hypothetical protein GY711_20530 [bacterium]|nr:hypothetical protein [bacterium]